MNFTPYHIEDNRLILSDRAEWDAVRKLNDNPKCGCGKQQLYESDTRQWWCPECDFAGERQRPRVFIHGDLFAVWDVDEFVVPAWAFERHGIHPQPSDIVRDVLHLIDQCPNVDFVLRTDEPRRVREVWPKLGFPDAGVPGTLGRHLHFDNVLLLANITTQSEADSRIPDLLGLSDLCKVGAWAVGAVELNLRPWLEDYGECEFCGWVRPAFEPDGIGNTAVCPNCFTSWEDAGTTYTADNSPLSTVFVGGEYADSIAAQCRDAGVTWEAAT